MSVGDVRHYRDSGLLPRARRLRGRSDDLGLPAGTSRPAHLRQHALGCGFTLDDVAAFIDPAALVTCRDVCDATQRRLEQILANGGADTRAAANLKKLRDACPGVEPRSACTILETLSGAEC